MHDSTGKFPALDLEKGINGMTLKEAQKIVLRTDPEEDDGKGGNDNGGCGDGQGCGRK